MPAFLPVRLPIVHNSYLWTQRICFCMKKPKFEHNTATIAEYEESMKLLSLKERTVENRLFGIRAFLTHIGEKDVKTITRNDVRAFVVSLRDSGKSVGTVNNYVTSTKIFLNWLFPDNDFFKGINIKGEKVNHNGEEIINLEGIKRLLAACGSQRDRALIFLMWDSAGRLGEILNLDVKDLKIEKHGILVHLNGKTGPRETLIFDAVPDVKAWLNLRKGELNDPLFPTPTGARLTHSGAQKMLKRVAKKAGLTEFSIHPHILRHGKLTYLSNAGMPEMHLRLFAGWSADSDMPAVYINPTKKDVQNKLLKINGIEPEDEPLQLNTAAPKKCPNCSAENPFDAVYCNLCSTVLDSKVAAEITAEATKKERKIWELESALTALRSDMEELKRAKQERETARKGFEPLFEEEKRRNEIVKKATGLDFYDAVEHYDVGRIAPPDSEAMKEFQKRVAQDKEYRERWKKATSGKVEKKEAELGKKALKTLADSL